MNLAPRADDAGSCSSANEAIEQTVAAGTIKNVSFMAVGPAIEDAAKRFRGRDEVALGLHATLNAEWPRFKWKPLVWQPALCDEGGFFLPSPAHTHHATGVSVEIILREIGAQFERLRELGLSISYLDEHMNFAAWGFPDTLPSEKTGELRARLREFCRQNGLIYASDIPVLPHAQNVGDELQTLQNRLRNAGEGDWIWITHPGKIAPDMNEFGPQGHTGEVARERDAERRLLCDPALPALFDESGVQLRRFDEIAAPPLS